MNTRNRKDDLKLCLESLLAQSYQPLEIIVVDNDSNDGTDQLLARFPVRVLTDASRRLSHLFNLGWKAARGDFIAFIPDDARAEVAWLSDLVAIMRSDASIGAVGGRGVDVGIPRIVQIVRGDSAGPLASVAVRVFRVVLCENRMEEKGRYLRAARSHSAKERSSHRRPRSMSSRRPMCSSGRLH